VPADGGPARIETFEPEAEIVRWIFDAYVEKGRSIRQISFDLLDRGILSSAGKPIWGTSPITRLLSNEAYIGTVYYNRREHFDGGGARNRKTRSRERPRDEWIAIAVPAIVDRNTFDRVKQVSRDNSKWNLECGYCHLGCNCHRRRVRLRAGPPGAALQSNERERARLIDASQAGVLELDEFTSRTATITARRDQLTPREEHSHPPQRRARHRQAATPSARPVRRASRRLARERSAGLRARPSPRQCDGLASATIGHVLREQRVNRLASTGRSS
jgi:hypothetical protein